MLLEALFILSLFNDTQSDDIFFVMDMWYEPEFYEGHYVKIQLIVVNFDIPKKLAYYSSENHRIVIEARGLVPAHILPNGECTSNLWHEILHAKWGDGSEGADHVRMVKEHWCA